MGTLGPTIGDPGLHLSHSKFPCNSPATNEVPLQFLPQLSKFFHLKFVCSPVQWWEERVGFYQSILQPFLRPRSSACTLWGRDRYRSH